MSNPESGRRLGPINITTEANGKVYNLETVFNSIKSTRDDPNDVFDDIFRVFSVWDANIKKKLDLLKLELVRKYPDEYDYIPDTKESLDNIDDHYKIKKILPYISFALGGIVICLIIVAYITLNFSPTNDDKKEQPTITDQLKPL